MCLCAKLLRALPEVRYVTAVGQRGAPNSAGMCQPNTPALFMAPALSYWEYRYYRGFQSRQVISLVL